MSEEQQKHSAPIEQIIMERKLDKLDEAAVKDIHRAIANMTTKHKDLSAIIFLPNK